MAKECEEKPKKKKRLFRLHKEKITKKAVYKINPKKAFYGTFRRAQVLGYLIQGTGSQVMHLLQTSKKTPLPCKFSDDDVIEQIPDQDLKCGYFYSRKSMYRNFFFFYDNTHRIHSYGWMCYRVVVIMVEILYVSSFYSGPTKSKFFNLFVGSSVYPMIFRGFIISDLLVGAIFWCMTPSNQTANVDLRPGMISFIALAVALFPLKDFAYVFKIEPMTLETLQMMAISKLFLTLKFVCNIHEFNKSFYLFNTVVVLEVLFGLTILILAVAAVCFYYPACFMAHHDCYAVYDQTSYMTGERTSYSLADEFGTFWTYALITVESLISFGGYLTKFNIWYADLIPIIQLTFLLTFFFLSYCGFMQVHIRKYKYELKKILAIQKTYYYLKSFKLPIMFIDYCINGLYRTTDDTLYSPNPASNLFTIYQQKYQNGYAHYLLHCKVFNKFSIDHLNFISNSFKCKYYERFSVIYRKNYIKNKFTFLLEGQMAALDRGEESLISCRFNAGSCFGVSALLVPQTCHDTIYATQPCYVVQMRYSDFNALWTENATLAREIYVMLEEYIHEELKPIKEYMKRSKTEAVLSKEWQPRTKDYWAPKSVIRTQQILRYQMEGVDKSRIEKVISCPTHFWKIWPLEYPKLMKIWKYYYNLQLMTCGFIIPYCSYVKLRNPKSFLNMYYLYLWLVVFTFFLEEIFEVGVRVTGKCHKQKKVPILSKLSRFLMSFLKRKGFLKTVDYLSCCPFFLLLKYDHVFPIYFIAPSWPELLTIFQILRCYKIGSVILTSKRYYGNIFLLKFFKIFYFSALLIYNLALFAMTLNCPDPHNCVDKPENQELLKLVRKKGGFELVDVFMEYIKIGTFIFYGFGPWSRDSLVYYGYLLSMFIRIFGAIVYSYILSLFTILWNTSPFSCHNFRYFRAIKTFMTTATCEYIKVTLARLHLDWLNNKINDFYILNHSKETLVMESFRSIYRLKYCSKSFSKALPHIVWGATEKMRFLLYLDIRTLPPFSFLAVENDVQSHLQIIGKGYCKVIHNNKIVALLQHGNTLNGFDCYMGLLGSTTVVSLSHVELWSVANYKTDYLLSFDDELLFWTKIRLGKPEKEDTLKRDEQLKGNPVRITSSDEINVVQYLKSKQIQDLREKNQTSPSSSVRYYEVSYSNLNTSNSSSSDEMMSLMSTSFDENISSDTGYTDFFTAKESLSASSLDVFDSFKSSKTKPNRFTTRFERKTEGLKSLSEPCMDKWTRENFGSPRNITHLKHKWEHTTEFHHETEGRTPFLFGKHTCKESKQTDTLDIIETMRKVNVPECNKELKILTGRCDKSKLPRNLMRKPCYVDQATDTADLPEPPIVVKSSKRRKPQYRSFWVWDILLVWHFFTIGCRLISLLSRGTSWCLRKYLKFNSWVVGCMKMYKLSWDVRLLMWIIIYSILEYVKIYYTIRMCLTQQAYIEPIDQFYGAIYLIIVLKWIFSIVQPYYSETGILIIDEMKAAYHYMAYYLLPDFFIFIPPEMYIEPTTTIRIRTFLWLINLYAPYRLMKEIQTYYIIGKSVTIVSWFFYVAFHIILFIGFLFISVYVNTFTSSGSPIFFSIYSEIPEYVCDELPRRSWIANMYENGVRSVSVSTLSTWLYYYLVNLIRRHNLPYISPDGMDYKFHLPLSLIVGYWIEIMALSALVWFFMEKAKSNDFLSIDINMLKKYCSVLNTRTDELATILKFYDKYKKKQKLFIIKLANSLHSRLKYDYLTNMFPNHYSRDATPFSSISDDFSLFNEFIQKAVQEVYVEKCSILLEDTVYNKVCYVFKGSVTVKTRNNQIILLREGSVFGNLTLKHNYLLKNRYCSRESKVTVLSVKVENMINLSSYFRDQYKNIIQDMEYIVSPITPNPHYHPPNNICYLYRKYVLQTILTNQYKPTAKEQMRQAKIYQRNLLMLYGKKQMKTVENIYDELSRDQIVYLESEQKPISDVGVQYDVPESNYLPTHLVLKDFDTPTHLHPTEIEDNYFIDRRKMIQQVYWIDQNDTTWFFDNNHDKAMRKSKVLFEIEQTGLLERSELEKICCCRGHASTWQIYGSDYQFTISKKGIAGLTAEYEYMLYKYPWPIFVQTTFIVILIVLVERNVCLDSSGMDYYSYTMLIVMLANVFRKFVDYRNLLRNKSDKRNILNVQLWSFSKEWTGLIIIMTFIIPFNLTNDYTSNEVGETIHKFFPWIWYMMIFLLLRAPETVIHHHTLEKKFSGVTFMVIALLAMGAAFILMAFDIRVMMKPFLYDDKFYFVHLYQYKFGVTIQLLFNIGTAMPLDIPNHYYAALIATVSLIGLLFSSYLLFACTDVLRNYLPDNSYNFVQNRKKIMKLACKHLDWLVAEKVKWDITLLWKNNFYGAPTPIMYEKLETTIQENLRRVSFYNFLNEHYIFSHLTIELKKQISENGFILYTKSGHELARNGNYCDYIYMIKEGIIHVEINDTRNKFYLPTLIKALTEQHVIGLREALFNIPYAESYRVAQRAIIWTMRRNDFITAINVFPQEIITIKTLMKIVGEDRLI